MPAERSLSALRLSIGRENTVAEIDTAVAALVKHVKRLRVRGAPPRADD